MLLSPSGTFKGCEVVLGGSLLAASGLALRSVDSGLWVKAGGMFLVVVGPSGLEVKDQLLLTGSK